MSQKSSFHSTEYRKALGAFATGITVVTATGAHGEPVGLTANSFTSVSLDPPLILWCLANSSDNLSAFQAAPQFAINILASDQRDISEHFAKRQKHKFSQVRFRNGAGGTPLLEGCATWLQCRLVAQHVAGDHHVFIGEVEHLETSDREALLYHQGMYAMSLPLPTRSGSETGPAKSAELAGQDLYSLLADAIHSYQERFETGQGRIVDNPYEARLLILLSEQGGHDLAELARRVQVPKAEAATILEEMQARGLLTVNVDGGPAVLTVTGLEKAAALRKLARQHEADALALIGNGQVEMFRRHLLHLIDWNRKTIAGS